MFQRPAPAENAWKFQRITQISRNSPTQSANHVKYTPFVNLLDIMFQAPALAENPEEIPVNYADSVQFVHIVCEPREIHQIC